MKVKLSNDEEITVDFQHLQWTPSKEEDARTKGNTICCINGTFVGDANCFINDQFNKSVGRKISLTRALQRYPFSKEDRKLIWKEYFKHCKS